MQSSGRHSSTRLGFVPSSSELGASGDACIPREAQAEGGGGAFLLALLLCVASGAPAVPLRDRTDMR